MVPCPAPFYIFLRLTFPQVHYKWISSKRHSLKRIFQNNTIKSNYTLTDISSQDIFYLFLLESSFDYKLVITIYRATMKESINIPLFLFSWGSSIPAYLMNLIYSIMIVFKVLYYPAPHNFISVFCDKKLCVPDSLSSLKFLGLPGANITCRQCHTWPQKFF